MKACVPSLFAITLCGFLSACGGSDTATEQAEPITNYTIATDLVGSGTITPENIIVEAGATQTFKLTSAEGYTLEMVKGCNGSLDRGELEYTVENLQNNCTIVASFAANKLSVDTQQPSGTKLTLDKSTYYYGDSLSATMVLGEGHVFESISGCNGDLAGDVYAVNKLTESCEIVLKTQKIKETFSDENEEQPIQVAVLDNTGTIAATSQGIISQNHPSLPEMPEGVVLPFELLALDINTEVGGTALVELTYSSPVSASASYIKSDGEQWYTMPEEQAQFSEDGTSVVLTLQDGGIGDSDGIANGVIKDPGGVAEPKRIEITTNVSGEGGISPSSQMVDYGSTASFTLSPSEGAEITEVSGCEGTLAGNTYTTDTITSPCQVDVSYSQQTFTVAASAGEGGDISPSTQTVSYGDSASFTLTANEGYKISEVTGCSGTLSGNTYTSGAITSACQVSASFSQQTFTVAASAGEGGGISPSTQTVSYGDSASFTLTADEGYEISKVTGCNGSLSGNIYSTGVITSACQVSASFNLKTFTVTASAGEGGGISPSTQTVSYGDTASFTFTANEGYEISGVTGCSGTLSGNTYTTGTITSACQISASFNLKTFTVAASAGEGGGISPSTQTVSYGDTASFTLTPNEGYEISEVAGCNGTLTGNTYTTGAITSACQVSASFSLENFKVTSNGLHDIGVMLSNDGVNWIDLTGGEATLAKLSSTSVQRVYIKLQEQVFTIDCEVDKCVITPFTLLKAYIAQAFSNNKEQHSLELISDVLGITSDPFLNEMPEQFNMPHYSSWVTEFSLLEVITTSAGDALDGYTDSDLVKSLFPQSKVRQVEEVSIELGESPSLDEGESARVYSVSTQQSSEQQGSTSGYLSDYVLQTASVDDQTQEVTTDIIYLGFNVERWKGQLNAETHSLTSAFLLNPTWLFLPESEKVVIAEKLLASSPFSRAVKLYQGMVTMGDFLSLNQYTALLEQAVMLQPELEASQLNAISSSATSMYQAGPLPSQLKEFKQRSSQTKLTAQACEPDAEAKPLISGMLLDQVTFENQSCDETVINSRVAVWYGWSDTQELLQNNLWQELSSSQMITPKELLRVTSEMSPVTVETGKQYALYKSHPNRLISKPSVFNTARGVSFVFKAIFGLQPVVDNKLTKKIKKVADKVTDFKESYEPVITMSEGVIASYQLLFEVLEPQLKGADSNTELYLKANKVLNNAQYSLNILKNIIGTLANDDNAFEKVDLKALFGEFKKKLQKRRKLTLTRYSKTTIKMATFYALLELDSDSGYVDIGGTKLPSRGLAYRLARFELKQITKQESVELESALIAAGFTTHNIKAIINLSATKIKGHFAKLITDPKFREAFLETLTDIDSIGKGAVAVLQNLASATLHNKEELLKAVVTSLLEGTVNKLSSNIVPTIIKSMGPQKYAQLILSGADLGVFAVDLAMKPDYLEYSTKACEDNSEKVCFAAVTPPVEILPYVVAVEDTAEESGIYLLDTSSPLSNSVSKSIGEALHDKHSWPDGSGWFNNNVNYLAGMPINNNSQDSAVLALSGAKLSYELDAFIAPHQFDAFQMFINGMRAQQRSLEFDWFVYPYKHQEWHGALSDVKPTRSKSNALNNNYVSVQVDADEYGCDLNKTGILSSKCKDVIIRAKSTDLTNPILKQYVNKLELRNSKQQSQQQVDTDNLAFLSFTKAAKKVGFAEYATFSSPGVRYVSSNMKLGDAKWQTGLNVFVVPDYSKSDENHISHQQTFIEQSTLYYNEQIGGQYLGVKLDRSSSQYNYFGGSELNDDYRIDTQAFYPVILARHNQTNELLYLEHPAVYLNSTIADLVSLKNLPDGYSARTVFLYDSVFASYLNNVGSNFVTWFKKRRPENHQIINSAKAAPVTYNQFAGQPYIRLDLNNTEITRVKISDELAPLEDTDGDGVADQWDSYPQDGRFAFDSDSDGMADKWERLYGFDPYSAEPDNGKGPNEDFDNDGYSNLAEFSKTLALPSDFTGYDPTTKTAVWRQEMLSLTARPGETLTNLVDDLITLYGEQKVAQLSFSWPEESDLALPQATLSPDGSSTAFTIPTNWPSDTSVTINLHAQLTSGENVISKVQVEGSSELEIFEYTVLKMQTIDKGFDGFDYPIGNRGLDVDGKPIPFSEHIGEQLNHSYSQGWVTDNHTRVNLASTEWRNAQDVGSFLGSYGNTLFGGVHPGEDWNLGAGTNDAGEAVYAVANGEVLYLDSAWSSAEKGGYTMVIAHTLADESQVYSVYTHITGSDEVEGRIAPSTDDFDLQPGDRVERGQLIARLATDMTLVSPHLHFELRTITPGPDLYPHDNGMGYYSHDGGNHSSMTAAQIIAAFNVMKDDEGLLDPSDFIDFNRSGVTGVVTSIATSQTPKLGEQFTLTINGSNMPNTMAAAVHDANCGPLYDISREQAKLDCTPNKAGKLFVYVKQASGGVFLRGAGNLWLDVAGSVNHVLGVEFSDTNFAQCVQEHVDSQQVTRLADLTTLDCSGRGIAAVTELSYMTGLTSLNLANNSLTTINLDDNLALTSADLRGNPFTQQALDYLATITHISDLKYHNTAPPSGGTGKLNDTGITWCADGSSNNLDCPVSGFEGQDAEHGRDALAAEGQLQKVGGGKGGFDFTKLDANGNPLPESASQWSCVKDNHTGLIWEVKTDDGGLHDKGDTYNWYNPNNDTNGGSAGSKDDDGDICYGYNENNEATYCNTHAFVERVNTQGLCGASDWRLPNKEELRSIVDYGTNYPSIDTDHFPHTQSGWYWSSSPYAYYDDYAWLVGFYLGYDYTGSKYLSRHVRLVRAGAAQ